MTTSRSLPDFIIIGAMKCGTSTLQTQLAAQESVFMSTPKEPNYFSDDEIFLRGQGWYEGLFAEAPPGALKGEASTHYTKLPTYPETLSRMTALLPELKLVYVIRNPVTRAVSHYIHEWTQRVADSDADAAFRKHAEFIEYGCYGMQIAPFVEAYGRENVLLSSLEALKTAPDAEFDRIADFLGLKGAAWRHDLGAQNVSAERFRRLPFQSVLIDNPVAAALRRTLVPAGLRRRIREGRQMTERPQIPAGLEARMKTRFLEDRELLAGIFPGHPALDTCYPFAGR